MTAVNNIVTDPSDDPIEDVKVVIRLRLPGDSGMNLASPGFVEAETGTISDVLTLFTDVAGEWSADLIPNASVEPTGSAYQVIEEPPGSAPKMYHILVPAAGGPYWVGDILTVFSG